MFTLEQIKDAHGRVKSGADFPKYVAELIQIGILKYDLYVNDGHAEYHGKNGFVLKSNANYPKMEIANTGNEGNLRHTLKIHQQGETDYFTFCKQAANVGVEKWTVDLAMLTCTYYDKIGDILVVEIIQKA